MSEIFSVINQFYSKGTFVTLLTVLMSSGAHHSSFAADKTMIYSDHKSSQCKLEMPTGLKGSEIIHFSPLTMMANVKSKLRLKLF